MCGRFPSVFCLDPTRFSLKFCNLAFRIPGIVDSGMKVIAAKLGFSTIPLIKWMFHIRRSGPQFEITVTLVESREEHSLDKLDKVVVICSFINNRLLKGASTNVIKSLLIRAANNDS